MRRSLGQRGLATAIVIMGAVLGASFAPTTTQAATAVEAAHSSVSNSTVSNSSVSNSTVSNSTVSNSTVSNSSISTELTTLADLLPNPTIIHPDIARQVQVDLRGLGTLPGDLSDARRAEADAIAAGHRSRSRQSQLIVLRRQIRADHVVAVAEVEAAEMALGGAKEDLAGFALGTFIGSSALALESFSTDTDTDTGPSPIPTLAADAEDVLVQAQQASSQRLARAEGERTRIAGELEVAGRELSEVTAGIVAADIAREVAAADAARIEPAFEAALRTAPVAGVDFPVVVLDAYYRAALRTAQDKPWCAVRWDHLAGIGKVESRHGTFGGNTVGADGRTDGEILGPVLDGTRFASIPDTDGGRFDLDSVWDRAVGPMQFIPGSWNRYGDDGNSDGVIDPHNMYDAALAAANHLCGTTGGLNDEANYQRALLGYNRSVPYGLMVMDFAVQYRTTLSLVPTSDSVPDSAGDVPVAALRIPMLD